MHLSSHVAPLGADWAGIDEHIPCFSAYFSLFSLTISKYPFPYLPSLNTVTITTGGLPDGLWYAGGACRLRPLRWNSHSSVRNARPARTMVFKRLPRIVGRADVRGRKGGGFEDFRGGYAKCIAGRFATRNRRVQTLKLWCRGTRGAASSASVEDSTLAGTEGNRAVWRAGGRGDQVEAFVRRKRS